MCQQLLRKKEGRESPSKHLGLTWPVSLFVLFGWLLRFPLPRKHAPSLCLVWRVLLSANIYLIDVRANNSTSLLRSLVFLFIRLPLKSSTRHFPIYPSQISRPAPKILSTTDAVLVPPWKAKPVIPCLKPFSNLVGRIYVTFLFFFRHLFPPSNIFFLFYFSPQMPHGFHILFSALFAETNIYGTVTLKPQNRLSLFGAEHVRSRVEWVPARGLGAAQLRRCLVIFSFTHCEAPTKQNNAGNNHQQL